MKKFHFSKELKLPKHYATDLAMMFECEFTDFTVGDLARVKMNETVPGKFSPVAFPGHLLCCTVVLRGRMPLFNLKLTVDSALDLRVHPVKNVIFPERSTLLPDMLLPENTPVNAGANTTVMFLLTAQIPAGQKPGKVRSVVTAAAEGYPEKSIEFITEIRPLPSSQTPRDHGKVIFWPHWETFCHHLGVELWSEKFWTEAEKYLAVMAHSGMNVVMASVCHDPFRYPLPKKWYRYNYYPAMVRWIKDAAGKWSFDYAVLDRYVDLNFRLGIDREIQCHSLLPTNLLDPVLGYYDHHGRFVEETTTWDSPKYEAAWRAFLVDFGKHAAEKGYLDKLTICPYDEPVDSKRFIAVAEMAKECIPSIRITAAICADFALSVKKVIDIATVHSASHYSEKSVAALRKAGVEVRWYNCCSPDWGNSLFASSLFDAYRQGWITCANGFAGYLRWSIIDWPEQLTENPGFNWPTGDTYQIYPGVPEPLPSLRLIAWNQGRADLDLVTAALDDPHFPESGKRKLRTMLRHAGKLAPLDDESISAWRKKLYRLLDVSGQAECGNDAVNQRSGD